MTLIDLRQPDVSAAKATRARRRRAYCTAASLLLIVLLFGSNAADAGQKPDRKSAKKPTAAPLPVISSTPDTSIIPAQTVPAPPPPPPPDPLGRDTPHGTVLGFLRAAEAQDYKRAAEYLDGKRPEEREAELATQLKALLDLSGLDINAISKMPEGDTEDQLRLSRDRVGAIHTPTGDMDVFLDRVERPKQTPIWLFSQETLNRVPSAYASVKHRNLDDLFPAWASQIRFLSVPLWRWGVILVSVLIVLALARLFTRLLLRLLKILFRSRMTPGIESAILDLRAPLFGMMLALLLHITSEYAITVLGRHLWDSTSLLIALVSGAWLLIKLIHIFASFISHRLTLQMRVERVTVVGLASRLSSILVVIVLIIVLLTLAGVNVSALVAGLGIGGIALALAAQKTLADLFGGISVVMRGAVRVGDFCVIDGIQGTVEDVGISSLNLRTLDRSLVSIPNSKVAEGRLENFSMRDQFWLHQVFTLRFDTPHKMVKTVLDRIVQLLASEPEIEKESARARLIGLTQSGPQIEVFAYFRRPGADWAMFLGVQEKIILKMMSIVESEGTSFAAPIGVVQLNRDGREKPVDSAGGDV